MPASSGRDGAERDRAGGDSAPVGSGGRRDPDPSPSAPAEGPGAVPDARAPREALPELAEPGGALDDLLGKLAADWRRFRWNPEPGRLLPLEEDVEALRRRLAAARAFVTGESPAEKGGGSASTSEADAGTLSRVAALEVELRRLLHRAAGLRAEPPPPGRRESPPERKTPRRTGAAETAAPTGEPSDDDVRRRIRKVDAHLAAVARIWKTCRSRPSTEEVGRLRSRLRDSLLELASLREFLQRSGAARGPAPPTPDAREAGVGGTPVAPEAREAEAGDTPVAPTPSRPAAEASSRTPPGGEDGEEPSPEDSRTPDGGGAADRDAAGREVRFPYRDSLTGSFSREGFDLLVRGEIKRCRRYERALSLLMLEVDRDGPRLRGTTEALRGALRGSDLVARHAERTVAVALPETTAEDARTVARRVLRVLTSTETGTAPFRMGLSTYPLDGETLSTLSEVAWLRLVSRAVGLGDAEGEEAI